MATRAQTPPCQAVPRFITESWTTQDPAPSPGGGQGAGGNASQLPWGEVWKYHTGIAKMQPPKGLLQTYRPQTLHTAGP